MIIIIILFIYGMNFILDNLDTPCSEEYKVMSYVCTYNKTTEVCEVSQMDYYNCVKRSEDKQRDGI